MKPSEIFETPEASGFDRVRPTVDVEETLRAIEYVLSHPDEGSGDIHYDLTKVLNSYRDTLLDQAEVEKVREDERERIMHEINAKVDNLSRCPEKPQRRSAFQDGFSDCLDQVMLILGKKVVCTNCMDRGYVKNILFDFLEKCDHPSHITPHH